MKTIISILFVILIASCSKEEKAHICETCTVNVTYQDGSAHTTQNYIESQTEYCNGEADTIKQGTISQKKISNDGGATFITTTKSRSCK